jgi:uncharacterized lipoprotein YmbA
MTYTRLLTNSCLAVLGLAVGACGTTVPERYYFLGLQAYQNLPVSGAVSDFAGAIDIVVTGVPDSVDRPNLVVETGANELALLENDRWAEPLKSGIERALSESIARALPKSAIAVSRKSVAPDTMRIAVRIDSMRLTYDGNAIMDATWSILDPPAGGRSAHRATVVHAVEKHAPDQLVMEWSQELDEIGQQIARSIDTSDKH